MCDFLLVINTPILSRTFSKLLQIIGWGAENAGVEMQEWKIQER